jgi:hypothetical protein
MADKNTKPESAAVAEPVAAAPVGDAFTARCEALASLWGCTVEEAKRREEARLAAKKLKAAA